MQGCSRGKLLIASLLLQPFVKQRGELFVKLRLAPPDMHTWRTDVVAAARAK